MNLKNFSKVGVRQYIIINIILLFLIQACSKVIPMNQLVFKDCLIYRNKQLFSGKYELYKGDKHILSKVYKGKIKNEKTYGNNVLLMEKNYKGCDFGFQKDFNLNGKKISEGPFMSNKRIGEWKYFTKDSIYTIDY